MSWFFKELKHELSRISSNCQNYNEKINNTNMSGLNSLDCKNNNEKIDNYNASELNSLDLKETSNIKILELGCGDASLWNKNFNHIPQIGK